MISAIENEWLRVEADTLGGELQSIRCGGYEYLWQGDPRYWEQKAPNLFPYIARLTEGRYTLHGKSYSMPIHGFGPTTEMKLEECGERKLVFRLDADEHTKACYPCAFTYRIVYELEGRTLKVCFEVINRGKEDMFFGIGGHPGFSVPMEEGLRFEDYYLEFEKDGMEGTDGPVRIGFSPACFLDGKDMPYPMQDGCRIPLSHDMFDQDAIVLTNTPKTVTLRSDKGSRYVRVRFPQMPYIGFWHAVKTDAPYICIEPWSSLPSRQDVVEELSEQPSLVRLPAQEIYRNSWSIEVG